MYELAIISGKGGTGKTSIVASLATMTDYAVLADCDVDAADLHLILGPDRKEQEDFSGGSRALIIPERCTGCGKCAELCRFDAISNGFAGGGAGEGTCRIDPIACEGCGVCAAFCEEQAIEFNPVVNGELYVSATRCGPMVHAKLGIAAENSGKLVSLVRAKARQLAREEARRLIVIDGPPGIGCPVIASLAGASIALVVTEPTLSGEHDLKRILELTEHFGIPAAICVNKWDLNPEMTEKIENTASAAGALLAGRVRYDRRVTVAQIHEQAATEHQCEAGEDMRNLWGSLKRIGEERGIRL